MRNRNLPTEDEAQKELADARKDWRMENRSLQTEEKNTKMEKNSLQMPEKS